MAANMQLYLGFSDGFLSLFDVVLLLHFAHLRIDSTMLRERVDEIGRGNVSFVE